MSLLPENRPSKRGLGFRLFAPLLIALMAAPVDALQACTDDGFEGNDDKASATGIGFGTERIKLGETVPAQICSGNDDDLMLGDSGADRM